MGVIDKIRDAARTENSIAQVPTTDDPSLRRLAHKDEPEAIARAYYIENAGKERRYYDDYQRKSLAMRATETSISSKREDLTTVRAMVDVAAARGWGSIDLKGSENFRREAWIEAAARGLEGRGYKPSDPDRQEAERRAPDRLSQSPAPSPQAPAPAVAPVAIKAQGEQPSRAV